MSDVFLHESGHAIIDLHFRHFVDSVMVVKVNSRQYAVTTSPPLACWFSPKLPGATAGHVAASYAGGAVAECIAAGFPIEMITTGTAREFSRWAGEDFEMLDALQASGYISEAEVQAGVIAAGRILSRYDLQIFAARLRKAMAGVEYGVMWREVEWIEIQKPTDEALAAEVGRYF